MSKLNAVENLGMHAKKGAIPWNKGVKGYHTSLKGRQRPDSWGKNISKARRKSITEKGVPKECLEALKRGGEKANLLRKQFGRFDLSPKSRETIRLKAREITKRQMETNPDLKARRVAGLLRTNKLRHERGRYDVPEASRESMRKKIKYIMNLPKYKENLSIKAKERFKNKEYKERIIKNTLKALFTRPTSFEQKIVDVINEHHLPFKYVGDGSVIINYVNPDFIGNNGNKQIIEVYYSWYKIRTYGSVENYEKIRAERFTRLGFKTLFLNEKDLLTANWKCICLDKINKFVGGV